jgi:hypothetical protein
VPIVLKSGTLNLLEPSGPVMGLPYLFTKTSCHSIQIFILTFPLETVVNYQLH